MKGPAAETWQKSGPHTQGSEAGANADLEHCLTAKLVGHWTCLGSAVEDHNQGEFGTAEMDFEAS